MISKDLVAASSRPIILSILAQEGESYGYALIQRVRALSKEELNWTDGMLYPVLHRLEREGLIAAEWKAADTGRQRKYYRLTRPGRAALDEEQQQWLSVHNTLARLWGLKAVSI